MSEEQKPVTINILDKEYTVACNEEERDSLHNSVEFLNEKMKEVRSNGKVVGSERIVVMAALNIVHEYLEYLDNNQGVSSDVHDVIKRVEDKISNALDEQSV